MYLSFFLCTRVVAYMREAQRRSLAFHLRNVNLISERSLARDRSLAVGARELLGKNRTNERGLNPLIAFFFLFSIQKTNFLTPYVSR